MTDVLDILLTQRFLPEFGGSIHYMHEVYRRWPGQVEVITHDYYNAPPHTAEFTEPPVRPASGDHVTAAHRRMDRRDIFMHDWGVESPARWLRYLRMTRAVRQRLKRARRVRVHCVHAVPEAVSLIPLRKLFGRRMRIISYCHGEEVTACESSRQLRFLMRRAHRVIDLMIANSRYTADLVGAHIDPAKVHIVHPGVEIARYEDAAAAGARWRAEQGLEGRPIVATLGRLDPRKNHAAVLDAVAALSDQLPALVYLIAGEGRQLPALKARAEQLGIASRVRFLGAVDESTKLAMLGACDVFAMPAVRDGTDVEGFGIVFTEAAACGRPAIAGNVGGQAEAVIDGETGLVVDGADQAKVTDALRRLLTDNALRDRLGQAGRVKARSLDWAAIARQVVDLVDALG